MYIQYTTHRAKRGDEGLLTRTDGNIYTELRGEGVKNKWRRPGLDVGRVVGRASNHSIQEMKQRAKPHQFERTVKTFLLAREGHAALRWLVGVSMAPEISA